MTAVHVALDALSDAHRMLMDAQRNHAAVLMSFGASPDEVEPFLEALDDMEAQCIAQRGAIFVMARAEGQL